MIWKLTHEETITNDKKMGGKDFKCEVGEDMNF